MKFYWLYLFQGIPGTPGRNGKPYRNVTPFMQIFFFSYNDSWLNGSLVRSRFLGYHATTLPTPPPPSKLRRCVLTEEPN